MRIQLPVCVYESGRICGMSFEILTFFGLWFTFDSFDVEDNREESADNELTVNKFSLTHQLISVLGILVVDKNFGFFTHW